MEYKKSLIVAAMSLCISGISTAQAGDMVDGYVIDGNGQVVTDGNGACVRHSTKTDVMLEECGYKVDIVVEKAPEATVVKVMEEKVVLEKVVIQNLQFAFDSAELTAQSKEILNDAVTKLTPWKESFRAQTSYAEVNGFTDTSGPEDYNLKLSQRRANAVADYLADQLGADRTRMQVSGMGEANPVADNSTREGRILNRRVEVNVIQK